MGRPPIGEQAMTNAERQQRHRKRLSQGRTIWKREHAGRYIHRFTRWIVQRNEFGTWDVYNPGKGRVNGEAFARKAEAQELAEQKQ